MFCSLTLIFFSNEHNVSSNMDLLFLVLKAMFLQNVCVYSLTFIFNISYFSMAGIFVAETDSIISHIFLWYNLSLKIEAFNFQ